MMHINKILILFRRKKLNHNGHYYYNSWVCDGNFDFSASEKFFSFLSLINSSHVVSYIQLHFLYINYKNYITILFYTLAYFMLNKLTFLIKMMIKDNYFFFFI